MRREQKANGWKGRRKGKGRKGKGKLLVRKQVILTTPGKLFSASRLGPSIVAAVDPVDESDEESGEDGTELSTGPILAVIN